MARPASTIHLLNATTCSTRTATIPDNCKNYVVINKLYVFHLSLSVKLSTAIRFPRDTRPSPSGIERDDGSNNGGYVAARCCVCTHPKSHPNGHQIRKASKRG